MDDDRADDPLPLRPLASMPSWLTSQVSRHAHRLVNEALAEEGMRRPHFTVLMALSEEGPASQAALGRRLWIDRSDLHAVLNDLERDGLVTRTQDQRDRRRNVIALTPAGVRAYERLGARVRAAQDALLEPLSGAERRRLLGLLTRVLEHHAARGRSAPSA